MLCNNYDKGDDCNALFCAAFFWTDMDECSLNSHNYHLFLTT